MNLSLCELEVIKCTVGEISYIKLEREALCEKAAKGWISREVF